MLTMSALLVSPRVELRGFEPRYPEDEAALASRAGVMRDRN